MPSYIPDNFEPRTEDYQATGVSQIPKDFLDVVVTPEFVEYWQELKDRKLKKGRKDAWFTTWRNRARFLWSKRGTAWENSRRFNGSTSELDPKARELAKQVVSASKIPREAQDLELWHSDTKKQPKDYPTTPPEQPPMTAEQAFNKLREQGII